MSQLVVNKLQARFGDKVLYTHAQCGDETVVLDRSVLHEACDFLKYDGDLQFDMPIDVTCVDYLGFPGPRDVPYPGRFELVYHLYSLTKKHRIRLKVPLDIDAMTVASVTDLWKGVDWFEREVWDMFGVRFDGHPNLRRILLYEEFEGHPLRKDYPQRGYQPRIPMPRLHGDPVPGLGGSEEDL